ncbi:MAG: transcriptional regulator [Bacillota bacterium]|nr:MAG: transcriptional regulator [Bacillota bacterium]
MFEWHRTIQRMVNIIERQIGGGNDELIALQALARELGYSQFHVTRQFKNLTGMTFRKYLGLRRLAHSVVELRDSDNGIIDIAMKWGFSSQEAYTRAFKRDFGMTPSIYRQRKIPLVLQLRPITFDPYSLGLGESSMSKHELQSVSATVVTLPAHKFLHIRNQEAEDYFGFWALQEKIPGQDCDTICGLLDSISAKLDRVTGKIGEFDGQIGAWFFSESGKLGYAYGIRLPAHYAGELPKQMLCLDVPQRDYVVFSHPQFDYEVIWDSVFAAVNKAMEDYDYAASGNRQDRDAFSYQIVNPEHLGYRVYVPIK